MLTILKLFIVVDDSNWVDQVESLSVHTGWTEKEDEEKWKVEKKKEKNQEEEE